MVRYALGRFLLISSIYFLVHRSTGNFSAGGGAGGCGAPRSAPATPLQLEPPRHVKHDKEKSPSPSPPAGGFLFSCEDNKRTFTLRFFSVYNFRRDLACRLSKCKRASDRCRPLHFFLYCR
ncbi:hypothetical protein EVAR_46887_1 [Eumeta japonica]|uniref:Secreted protein n=1 Tax=Eumeta variegata TaxID=151549 RepID=A0A4C1YH36_EUMVA|nr:hypothetical protein EVAR_46887_1 [Eumeta japonica]